MKSPIYKTLQIRIDSTMRQRHGIERLAGDLIFGLTSSDTTILSYLSEHFLIRISYSYNEL